MCDCRPKGPRVAEAIACHFAPHGEAEAAWIAARLKRLEAEGRQAGRPLSWNQVGVLVRPNHRAETVARGLERLGIPHLPWKRMSSFAGRK